MKGSGGAQQKRSPRTDDGQGLGDDRGRWHGLVDEVVVGHPNGHDAQPARHGGLGVGAVRKHRRRHALRGGSVVGDHEVILAGENEQIRLAHRAEDRDIFARGALKAALWAQDQSEGLYSMQQVLGL